MMDLEQLMQLLEQLKRRQAMKVPMSAGGFPMGGAEGLRPQFMGGAIPGINGAPMQQQGPAYPYPQGMSAPRG